jgi:hypothetical protein
MLLHGTEVIFAGTYNINDFVWVSITYESREIRCLFVSDELPPGLPPLLQIIEFRQPKFLKMKKYC